MKRIIVIGASAASISFMTKLRTFDKTSEVICFSGEKHMPYNRCFLADVLSKEKSTEAIQLKRADFYTEKILIFALIVGLKKSIFSKKRFLSKIRSIHMTIFS